MKLAQTNLQLYRQLQDAGYGSDSVENINEAYFLAADCTSMLFRGSGKPFVCHLVGTASALVYENCRAEIVTAALLHAVYQDRVPFPHATSLEDRRRVLEERFGADTEALVYGYQEFELEQLDRYDKAELAERSDVVFMRLADELEDLYDFGLLMHGKKGEDDSVKGTAAWRLSQKKTLLPELLRAARAIDANRLADAIAGWVEQSGAVWWPAGLRSGRYSSYSIE